MTLSLITQPTAFVGSGSDSFFRVQDSAPLSTNTQMAMTINEGPTTLLTSYANVYYDIATFSMRELWPQVFHDWPQVWANALPNTRTQMSPNLLSRVVQASFFLNPKQLDTGNIEVFRGVDSGFGTLWGGSASYSGTLGYLVPPGERIARRELISPHGFPLTMMRNTSGTFNLFSSGFLQAFNSSIFRTVHLWVRPLTTQTQFSLDGTSGTTSQVYLRLVHDTKCYPRAKTLHWINSRGGWDFYSFPEEEQKIQVEGDSGERWLDFQTREVWGETKQWRNISTLTGKKKSWEWNYHLKDLFTSPRVVDHLGHTVRVIDTDYNWNYTGVQEPRVRIEYLTGRGWA
jgi:hypothetical protein